MLPVGSKYSADTQIPYSGVPEIGGAPEMRTAGLKFRAIGLTASVDRVDAASANSDDLDHG